MKKGKLSNKDLFLFWSGILIAILFGLSTNLVVTSAFDIKNNSYDSVNTISFIASAIILIFIAWFVNKKLKILSQ